ncbi:penicillin-binding protein 2 [Candidatus Neoehrlichia lotoris str. RAC413]|uniref:Penicillin-binding protein 2 n=2 Tax=Candidatus Neoehrlichia procyonis TaxID=467750 RepID=A0A0F3NMP2_9RICK|nr:penicillin-binding protein 2 [Candidatus Neoehrlichia lotoris str. RAC413]
MGLQLVTVSVLTSRLYYLQIVKRNKYQILSDNNRIRETFLLPIRGKILDRNNVELATNKLLYKVLCEIQCVKDVDGLLVELLKLTNKPIKSELIHQMKNNKANIITIYEEIDWYELSKIEFNIEKLSGVYVVPFYKRYYPFSNDCAHIIGYIKNIQGSDYNQYNEIRMGVTGIEYTDDNRLKGALGFVKHEVNAKRKIVRELSRIESISGNNVKLTLDILLQKTISQMLNGNNGAVVVLEIETGNVLALCSSPSYDNNMFINGLSYKSWNKINSNHSLPLINRAIALQTEPASTFKIITALAALKDNVIDVNKKILCTGSLFVGGREFHCWNHRGHGWINMRDAIASSCNVYFFTIAQYINIEIISNIATTFGFAQMFNTGLLEEVMGIVPDKGWRESNLSTAWKLGDTLNIVIGHGYLLVTPLQLAIMIARVASGRKVIPVFHYDKKYQKFLQLDVNNEHLRFVQNALFKVVNSSIGTASKYLRRAGVPILITASGKTGSVQVSNIKSDVKKRDHGIFVGYAPFNSPKYAVSVFMEHTGGAGKSTVLAQNVFNYMLVHGFFD